VTSEAFKYVFFNAGLTAFNAAVKSEEAGTAIYLMAAGADPNVGDENGVPALHLASRLGLVNLVKAMVKNGANVDSESPQGQN
jgi:ankyrin repeat protein